DRTLCPLIRFDELPVWPTHPKAACESVRSPCDSPRRQGRRAPPKLARIRREPEGCAPQGARRLGAAPGRAPFPCACGNFRSPPASGPGYSSNPSFHLPASAPARRALLLLQPPRSNPLRRCSPARARPLLPPALLLGLADSDSLPRNLT